MFDALFPIEGSPCGYGYVDICRNPQMEIDLRDPENTVYTFGERPRTLTENVVKAEEEMEVLSGRGGGCRSVKEEVGDIVRWAKITTDEKNAYIQLTAGELNKINGNLSAVEIEMDGIDAELKLAASKLDNVANRTTSVELVLNGTEAKAGLIASVIEQGERISSAELTIDGINSEIALKADKITLNGYVTMSKFEAEIAAINHIFAGYSEISSLGISGNLYAANANFTNNLRIYEHNSEWQEVTLYKGGHVGISSTTSLTVWDYNGNPIGKVNGIPSGFNFTASSQGTYNFLGH